MTMNEAISTTQTAVPMMVNEGSFIPVPIGNTSIEGKKIAACCYKKEDAFVTVQDMYDSFMRKKLLRVCPVLDEGCEIIKNPKLFGKVFGEHHVIDWHFIFRGKNYIRCWFLSRENQIRSYFLMLNERISNNKITVIWA